MIIFGSVRFLSKKVIKLNFFFFEKKTETEPKPGQTDRFRFGSVRFFEGKNRFKPVWLGFSGFGLVFSVFSGFGLVFSVFSGFGSVWLSFFPVFCRFRFGSVRFFWFFAYKTETEPNRPVFSKI